MFESFENRKTEKAKCPQRRRRRTRRIPPSRRPCRKRLVKTQTIHCSAFLATHQLFSEPQFMCVLVDSLVHSTSSHLWHTELILTLLFLPSHSQESCVMSCMCVLNCREKRNCLHHVINYLQELFTQAFFFAADMVPWALWDRFKYRKRLLRLNNILR